MMRIGIITLNDFYNYGNRLQNYALHRFIENLNCNHVVDTIWYTPRKTKLDENKFSLNNFRKYIFNRHGYRKTSDAGILFHQVIREYNIKKFSDRYLNIAYDYCIKNDLNDRYDFFIVGSDQVWNPHWVNSSDVFLEFANSDKRIAYSASFGISELPKDKEAGFKKGLEGMKHISVREHAGAEIVKKLTGREVPILLDPTLTLTKDQWNKIVSRPAWYKDEKYILVFFLSMLPELARNEIEHIAKENNLKIFDLMDEANIDYYTSTPEEFLYLIKNAELVYTDSFHCTVFSILFNTAFVNCSRENMGMNMDSRMDTLLGLFNLQHRKTDKRKNYIVEKPLELKYPDVEAILEPEREKSRKFLLNALGLNI